MPGPKSQRRRAEVIRAFGPGGERKRKRTWWDDADTHGWKRPDADVRRDGEWKRKPAVRAGTERLYPRAGAPGRGAARVTKTQVRVISGGAARASITPETGGGEANKGATRTRGEKGVVQRTGARAAVGADEAGVK